MRRSSGRTARTDVEIEWAGWSQAAISEEDPGEEDGFIMLCWMVDAARLSGCAWEWRGVGRGRGLCYETDRRTKRRLKDDYSPTGGACRPRLLAMPCFESLGRSG